jgi:ketosteroid isomerase-like protein
MRQVSITWKRGDYRALRKLLHPEGMWFLVDADPRFILGVSEFIDAIALAQRETVFDFSNDLYEELAEGVLLSQCQIRRPLRGSEHGHTLGRYFFLLEVRDGLFARSESFPTEVAARDAFEAGWVQKLEATAS